MPTPTPTPSPGQTGFSPCRAQAAVTADAGDNDGFEIDADAACADDGVPARDMDSGAGSPNSCDSPSKDRHVFARFDLSVPAGSTVSGVEVRLDAWADDNRAGPQVCVELSWDGGASWTSSKSSPALSDQELSYVIGGASDTWDRAWSPADFSDQSFLVRVTNKSSNDGRDFFLDFVAVQVTYQ